MYSKDIEIVEDLFSMTIKKAELKGEEYIVETETFVLPLIRITKEEFPEYQDVLFILKYHIVSVLDSIKGVMQTYDIDFERNSENG